VINVLNLDLIKEFRFSELERLYLDAVKISSKELSHVLMITPNIIYLSIARNEI
jgi:hypothetical protein